MTPTLFRYQDCGREVASSNSVMAYAIHNDRLILMVAIGSDTGISAVRGMLYNGDKFQMDVRGMYGYSYCSLGKEGGEFKRFQVPESDQHIGIITDKALRAVLPQESYTYVMSDVDSALPDENATELIGQRLAEAINVGVLEEWYPQIIQAGIDNMAIAKTKCIGCSVWAVSTNGEAWARVISELLISNEISFPVEA